MSMPSCTVAPWCTMAWSAFISATRRGWSNTLRPMETPALPAYRDPHAISSSLRVESMRSPPAMTTGQQQPAVTRSKVPGLPV